MSLFKKNWSFGREQWQWPVEENGQQEKAAVLTCVQDASAEAEVLLSLLRSCDIPCTSRYAQDGIAGKVVLGFSGYGVDILVPESRLEEAKALLAAQPAEEDTL